MSATPALPSIPILPPLVMPQDSLSSTLSSSQPDPFSHYVSSNNVAALSSATLRKSLSVDSFVKYSRDTRTSVASPTVASRPGQPYTDSKRSHPTLTRSSREQTNPLVPNFDSTDPTDSDVDRYDPLSSPVERYRQVSLTTQEPYKPVIRGGHLPLPSRAPSLGYSSSMGNVTTSVTYSANRSSRKRSDSTQSPTPESGRARSESLGIYSSPFRKPTLIDTNVKSARIVTLVVTGTKDSGKSAAIRKGLTGYGLSDPVVTIKPSRLPGGLLASSYSIRIGRIAQSDGLSHPLHVIEVDLSTAVSKTTNAFDIEDIPAVDGVIVCYDSTNQRSFQPVETLLQGYRSLKVPTLVLACKSDLERQIDPEEAVAILCPYDVGLVEVTSVDDPGKTKLRQSFNFLLKAIFRNRLNSKTSINDLEYRNPASPGILGHLPLWDNSRTATPTALSAHTNSTNLTIQETSISNMAPVHELPMQVSSDVPLVSSSTAGKLGSTSIEHPVSEGGLVTKAVVRSSQWVYVEELLDKVLFLAVSGDDPIFMNHFLMTYRRFTTPRTVLLAMQKRMRQLDSPSEDPMFACFAQMRICHLLETWIHQYGTDFAVKGTFGALDALIKSILSKTHLLHYGSELLPFLEILPTLQDRDAAWALPPEVSEDEDDEPYEDDDEARLPNVALGSNAPSSEPGPILNTSQPHLPSRERKPSYQLPKSLTPYNLKYQADVSPSRFLRDLQKLANEVLVTEPLYIAEEITKMEEIMLLGLEARRWLRYTLVPGKKDDDDPITAFNIFSNHLADWVVSLILCHDKPKARARQMNKFMDIGHKLRLHNNYSALRAFVAGINSATFQGDETLDDFNLNYPEQAKCLQSWDVLLKQNRAHRSYRLALRNSKGSRIPALEVHMSDLIKAHEGNQDKHESEPMLIHWGKYDMLARFIDGVTDCQTYCRNHNDYNKFPDRPEVRRLLARPVMSFEMQKARLGDGDDRAEKSISRSLLKILSG